MEPALEEKLIPRLTVLAGGWTVEAAESICSGNDLPAGTVRALLSNLAERSVIGIEHIAGTLRYHWMVPRPGPEDAELPEERRRHRDYFLALAEDAERHLTGSDQAAWLEQLEADHANFLQALAWSTAQPVEEEANLRLAGALARFWWMRGHAPEGRRWLEAALQRPGGSRAVRAKALQGAGAVTYAQADYSAARTYYEKALAIRSELDDAKGVAGLLNLLGMVSREQGDLTAAGSLHEQSLQAHRGLGDRWGEAGCLSNLGVIALLTGDPEKARAFHEEGLAVRRGLGDELGVASSLTNLGNVARAQGELSAARECYEQGLAIRRGLGDRWGMAGSLLNLAVVAREQSDFIIARRLLEESLSLFQAVADGLGLCEWLEAAASLAQGEGNHAKSVKLLAVADQQRQHLNAPLPRHKRVGISAELDTLRRTLGDTVFTAIWEEGARLSIEEVASAF